jgi:urease accessory protein
MKKSAVILLASAILFAPSVAFAHPGQGAGILAGFLHPFTGVDHFLALVSLGVFATQLTPRRSLALGGGFLSVFILAFAAARSNFSLPAHEAVLAASLLGMGMLVMVGRRLPFALSLSVTALFAAYHGSAHGVELGAFALTSSLAGFFLAGLMLTGGAYAVGRLLSSGKEHAGTAYRAAAACLASCTSLLLLAGT